MRHHQSGRPGFSAVTIAEGPTERARATPQLVSILLAPAQQEVLISTPYFIPDTTVLDALCAAALREVRAILILPTRSESHPITLEQVRAIPRWRRIWESLLDALSPVL